MNYSITPILHHRETKGLHKIIFQVIYNRIKAYAPTVVKIPADNWDKQALAVIKHKQKSAINSILSEQRNAIDSRLLAALRNSTALNKQDLEAIAKGTKKTTDTIAEFINDLADTIVIKKNDKQDGVKRHVSSLGNKVEEYFPGATFNQVNLAWLQSFESKLYQRKNRYSEPLDGNTVHGNMKRLKGVLSKAAKLGLIDRKVFEDYTPPPYKQKIPEYLTEVEMEKLFKLLQQVENETTKRAGYYWLLGGFAGYRISDLSTFDYAKRVRGDNIILRAQKNGNIVSIHIHSRLKKVLDYIKDKPLGMAEKTMREEVKKLMALIGINRDVSVHTGRHSFAMMLASNGFSLDEAARLLGDSKDVATVYYRITDQALDKKIKERLG